MHVSSTPQLCGLNTLPSCLPRLTDLSTCLATTCLPVFWASLKAGFGNFRMTKHANAYMLVYVRESEWDTVMCQVTEQDISAHVRARLKVSMGACLGVASIAG